MVEADAETRNLRVGIVVVGVADLRAGGGAERFFADLVVAAHEFDAKYASATLICDRPTLRALTNVGRILPVSKLRDIPTSVWINWLTQGLALIRGARDYDVIHISQALPRHIPWLIVSRIFRLNRSTAIVLNINDSRLLPALTNRPLCDRPGRLEIWSYKLLLGLGKLNGIYCWYNDLKQWLDSSRYARGRVVSSSSYCFVDSNRFAPSQRKKMRVVFAARMVPVKRPMQFVEALIMARSTDPATIEQYDFMFFGDGPLRKDVDQLIHESGLSDLCRWGDADDLADVMSESLLFASTQDIENFTSLSMLEAMACGNAVIAFDVGQTSRFVRDGENGASVKSSRTEDYARALHNLLSNRQTLYEMGEQSREIAEREHCFSNVWSEILQLWRSVAQNSDPTRDVS